VASDEALRRRLVQAGRARLGLFSWHASAANLVAACQRIASSAPAAQEPPVQALVKLNGVLHEIEADREARLDVINRINALLEQTREESAARLDVIHRLTVEANQRTETIHHLQHALREVEADRLRLHDQLHSTRALGKRLVRHVLGKVFRVARPNQAV
jgi:hypothetical protein